jgi:hypothetical protein
VDEYQLQLLDPKYWRAMKRGRHAVTDWPWHDRCPDSILNQVESFLRGADFLPYVRLEALSRALFEQPLMKGRMGAMRAWNE